MISTGTGIAPFASLVRDPDTYEKFDADHPDPHLPRRAELDYGSELVGAWPTTR